MKVREWLEDSKCDTVRVSLAWKNQVSIVKYWRCLGSCGTSVTKLKCSVSYEKPDVE